MPKRKRTSKFGVERGERYALIPEEILESDNFHAQPDWGKCVMLALACRYNGHNNGDLSLPFSEAKRLGISAQWKLYAGLRLLEKADLIECTRRGRLERGTKLASLYALTWRGIDPCENVAFDAGISVCPIPSHTWVKWQKPGDWKTIVKDVSQANHGREKNSVSMRLGKFPVSTTLGNGRSTTLGNGKADIAQPPWVMETPFIAPKVVDTSKTLGRGERRVGSGSDPDPISPPNAGPNQQAQKLDSTLSDDSSLLSDCIASTDDKFREALLRKVRAHLKIQTAPNEIKRQLAQRATPAQIDWAIHALSAIDRMKTATQRTVS